MFLEMSQSTEETGLARWLSRWERLLNKHENLSSNLLYPSIQDKRQEDPKSWLTGQLTQCDESQIQ